MRGWIDPVNFVLPLKFKNFILYAVLLLLLAKMVDLTPQVQKKLHRLQVTGHSTT